MFGGFALLLACAAAGWLLWRMAKGDRGGGDRRNVTLLKGVIFLGLAAVLFVAKLWPLAFMVLVAAGGVTAIELWRDRAIRAEEAADRQAAAPRTKMSAKEAAAILGVAPDADADTVRAAHRRLIAQLHPDKGGSDFLAAQINAARETLESARAVAPPKGEIDSSS